MERKKVPIAWIVRGNRLIPIEWDDGRILDAIKRAIRCVEKEEKRKREINRLMEKLDRHELMF